MTEIHFIRVEAFAKSFDLIPLLWNGFDALDSDNAGVFCENEVRLIIMHERKRKAEFIVFRSRSKETSHHILLAMPRGSSFGDERNK